jgi:23S rRNA (cytidine1920-2'-O)/16S rRNA (cytidine1409-2'-O)-methyltransferase
MAQDKLRLDQLLVQRGLAASRDRARALIMTGDVLVADRPVDKPGTRVATDAEIRLRGADHPYVGRGGLKLAGALDDLALDVAGLRCLDVGASTGGFTDCLLRRGATAVVAVDVGTNQLHWRLRSDERVTVFEQTDIRALDPTAAAAPFPLAVIDTSFISLRLVLPPTAALIQPGGHILAMLKPQFEVGRADVGKGGLVRDPAVRARAIEEIVGFATEIGLTLEAQADSRLPGAKKGNVEHFLLLGC